MCIFYLRIQLKMNFENLSQHLLNFSTTFAIINELMLQYLQIFDKQQKITKKNPKKFKKRHFNSLEKFLFNVETYNDTKMRLNKIQANIIAEINQSQITWDGIPFKQSINLNEFLQKYQKFYDMKNDLVFLIKFLENNETVDLFEKYVNENEMNVSKIDL